MLNICLIQNQGIFKITDRFYANEKKGREKVIWTVCKIRLGRL